MVVSSGTCAIGAGPARNRAITQSSGVYLCILDADDWMADNRLSKQLEACQKFPEVVYIIFKLSNTIRR